MRTELSVFLCAELATRKTREKKGIKKKSHIPYETVVSRFTNIIFDLFGTHYKCPFQLAFVGISNDIYIYNPRYQDVSSTITRQLNIR